MAEPSSPLDRLAKLLFLVDRKRLAVFPDGWGEPSHIDLLHRSPTVSPAPPAEVVWSRKEEHRGFRIRRGVFPSPAADVLPPSLDRVAVEWIEPGGGTSRTVILFPAWNDHGFAERRKLGVLLAERGVGSVSFEAAFYGSRRTTPEPLHAIRTVGDFARLGYSAIIEGRALASAFSLAGDVGVSGYSMGGNLAALASATLPGPLATAVFAASHSPGPVYLDGVLRSAIAWRALGTRHEAEETLRRHLSAVSVLNLPPLPHHRSAVLIGATGDDFVPPEATRALHQHWEDSSLTWVRAGHATLLWRNRPLLADAIVRAFDRLDAL